MIKQIYNVIKQKLIWLLMGGFALAATVSIQPTEYKTTDEIITAEENYFKANGKYLQVLPGNKLPHYETGTVKDKLGKDVPLNIRIDVYETWDKKRGYQIQYEDDTAYYSIATGTEKVYRTYTKVKPILNTTASSTTK